MTGAATCRCHAPGCNQVIPKTRFGCHAHWFALSLSVRNAIKKTAKLPLEHRDRREAVKAAIREWRQLSQINKEPNKLPWTAGDGPEAA